MSGMVGSRRRGGEDRFYSPPALRRNNQQRLQQQLQQQPQQSKSKVKSSSAESEKRIVSDDGASSTSSTSLSSQKVADSTNLDRFLEHTTPKVPAQLFSKSSLRGWRNYCGECHPYFALADLWESFREWSAYGAGVPLVLNGSDSVIQYYVPYLSGIQLYIDPSRPSFGQRRQGEESDSDSSRETSSDDSVEYRDNRINGGIHGAWGQENHIGDAVQGFKRLSLQSNISMGSVDESELSNPQGLLVFEYLEQDPPYNRQPLAEKISVLAAKFPDLRTYRSCDLTCASWMSVAWYPIYRIPTGPTLQNLDACFLTFHSLHTPLANKADFLHKHCPTVTTGVHENGMPFKLPLQIFGLASYKFKVSVWNSNEVHESQKFDSLSQAADNWLRALQVNHPDHRFFMSHNSYWR